MYLANLLASTPKSLTPLPNLDRLRSFNRPILSLRTPTYEAHPKFPEQISIRSITALRLCAGHDKGADAVTNCFALAHRHPITRGLAASGCCAEGNRGRRQPRTR